jgi:cell division protein DivIC
MKFLTRLPAFLRNKYFVSFSAFTVILLFLDKNDVFTQIDRRVELKKLKESKAYFTAEISSERKELQALKHNPATLEKYAREKYLMKREEEELFIVPEISDNVKN